MQYDLLNRPDSRTCILTVSGYPVDLAKPLLAGLKIEDIAHHLGRVCRWVGAPKDFYSVAEHSVLSSHMVPRAIAFDALMHDAEEFVTGDMPTPLKELLGYDLVKSKLRPLKRALARHFGYRLDLAEVKHVDLVCQATELRDLMPPCWMDWGQLPPPSIDTIVPVGSVRATEIFLERYYELLPGAKVAA